MYKDNYNRIMFLPQRQQRSVIAAAYLAEFLILLPKFIKTGSRLLIRFLILAIAFLSASLSQAQGAVTKLILTESQASAVAGPHMQWWFDTDRTGSIYSLLDASVGWQNSQVDIPNLGYRRFPVWFRFSVENRGVDTEWNLVIDYPLIRDLDVFVVQGREVVDIFQLGERFAFNARPVKHRNYIIPFSLDAGSELEFYIRVEGPYAVQMPVTIKNAAALLEYEGYAVLLHGLFFGFVVVMGFYNLFLFLSTRETPYFFYVCFTFLMGLFQFVQQGFAYQVLWPTEVAWQTKSTGVLLHLCLISSYLFVNSFLNLRQSIPWNFKAIIFFICLSVVALATAPFMDEFWTIRFGVLLVVPAIILAVVGGLIAWHRGRSDAKYFSIAWFAFWVGGMLLALNKLGLLPRNHLTEHGAEVGMVIELTLLAFALADRIKTERNQSQELANHARAMERAALMAKERALELEKMNSEQLERSVRARTRDLHKALSELSQMNKRLEQLNQVDSVTGVGNENSFLVNLSKEWDRSYRDGEVLSLIVVELDNYRDILADYGSVASDECLKNVATILERLISRPADCITRYGDKVFGIILPGTDEKGADHLAARIVESVAEQPFDFGIARVQASVSVGVAAVLPKRPDQHQDLLMSAESAVYMAKSGGGNRVEFVTIEG
ncbi:MAG: hypothetical protein CMK89_03835 [Pseudomonadales bacterium]|nr:hypothetical protein [Pseudomonadales bacterium]